MFTFCIKKFFMRRRQVFWSFFIVKGESVPFLIVWYFIIGKKACNKVSFWKFSFFKKTLLVFCSFLIVIGDSVPFLINLCFIKGKNACTEVPFRKLSFKKKTLFKHFFSSFSVNDTIFDKRTFIMLLCWNE